MRRRNKNITNVAALFAAVGGGGGGGGPLTFVWKSSAVSGATPAPDANMFVGQAIGTASADRFVVVAISWRGSGSANQDIPSNGVTIGGVTATLGAYYRGSGTRATAIFFAKVPTGPTATIGITGYVNGWIDEIIINTGIITGSGTASNPSNVSSNPPGYSNGGTGQAITVPASGVTVIAAISDNNGFAPTTGFTNATLDKDQYDANTFGITGSMAHLTASATVTMSSNNGAGTGWVASNFLP